MSTPIRPLSSTQFPAPAASDTGPEIVETPLLPETTETGHSSLHSAAETVGNAVGRAMTTVKQLPRRFTVIRGRGAEKASATAEDVKRKARNRAEIVRERSQFYIDNYPVQVIGGVFVTFFVIGAVLRIWRTRD